MRGAVDPGRAAVEEQVRALVLAGDVHALRAVRDRAKAQQGKKAAHRVVKYMHDPAGWARDVIDWGPGEGLSVYQSDILTSVPVHKRVAVRGPHGLGKSALGAISLLWFASTREAAGIDWKVIATASAWRHLSVYLFPEVRKWARRIKWDVMGRAPYSELHELLTLNLKLIHGAATPVASTKPELIEGAHADSLFYLIDEAKIVLDGTWDAIEGAFSGGRQDGQLPEAFALAISTPGPPVGRFYDIHTRKPGLEDWHVRHVTLAEAVAAGRISQGWAEQRARQWGRDSAMFHNRVLGEFYASDEDSVIPLAWVEAAVERWHAWDEAGRPELPGRHFTGVDVARAGSDSTVFAHRIGLAVIRLEVYDREDTMQTTARVQAATGEEDQEGDVKAVPVIDSIGVGSGVVDRLRELGVPVLAYTGAAKTSARDRSGEWGFTNCLTGDARVLPVGQLQRIYRSRYEGPLFRVKTARGDEFTATPNHQVLTRRGWVTVQALNAGDELLSTAGADTPVRAAAVWPEVDDVPPTLSELYSAAHRDFGAERVQGGTVDFHGDRPAGEVDVVSLYRNLLPLDPPVREERQQRPLVRPLLGQGALLGEGLLTGALRVGDRHGRVRAALPYREVPGSAYLSLLQRQAVLSEGVRLLQPAPFNVVVPQDVGDHVLTHAEGPSEGQHRLSADVAAHDLRLVYAGSATGPGHVHAVPQGYPVIPQDAADGVHVDAEALSKGELCLTGPVPGDEVSLIDVLHADCQAGSFSAAAWLDTVFTEDAVNGGPVRPERLRERCERLPGDVPADQVISVERTASGHGGTYVFTLETSTGSYRSQSVAHRNCRSAAYWHVRELLDPAFSAELMLPPDDLLLADLTTPTWDVTTGVPPKIRVEKKDDVVARLGRSPDRGDAVAMSLWAERLAASSVQAPIGRVANSKAAGRYGRSIGSPNTGGGSSAGGVRPPSR